MSRRDETSMSQAQDHEQTHGPAVPQTRTARHRRIVDILNRQPVRSQSQLAKLLSDGVEALGHPLISHVRGSGLLLGIVLTEPLAPQAQQAAQDAGFLVNAPAPDVVRLMPPLNLGDDEVEALLQALPGVLDVANGDG